MSDLKDISTIIDPEFGLVRLASVHPKPMWFSEAKSAHALCSNTTGAIVMTLEEYYRKRDEPRRDTVPGDTASRGMGLGYSYEEALMKAVCEGIERYCGRVVNRERHEIVYGSYAQLQTRGDALHPALWNILDDKQYADNADWQPDANLVSKSLVLNRVETDTKLNWVQLPELGSGEQCWVPVQAAFLGLGFYEDEREDEFAICEPISTGMACGQTYIEAVMSGIYETVERDAIMGMWINRLTPPRVDLEDASIRRPRLRQILKELGRTQYRILVNDLTSDFGIPTMFATLLYDQMPYTIVGAGCHHDPEIAVEKALMEIMMALAAYAQMEVPEKLTADAEIVTMHDHANLYMFNDFRERLAFLQGGETIGLRTARWDGQTKESILADLVASIRACGHRVFVNDVTIPEVAGVGLSVVKVVIPGLLPLNNLHRNTPNGAARLAKFSTIFDRKYEFGETVNPWPHPFP